jgi:hypothetical protein
MKQVGMWTALADVQCAEGRRRSSSQCSEQIWTDRISLGSPISKGSCSMSVCPQMNKVAKGMRTESHEEQTGGCRTLSLDTECTYFQIFEGWQEENFTYTQP